MSNKRIMFHGGKVRVVPEPLNLKQGDEVNIAIADTTYPAVMLSFSPASPFAQSSITLKGGEQANLTVKLDTAKGKYRIVATPQLDSAKTPWGTGSEPPGTVSGDLEVITEPPSPDDLPRK